MSQFILNFRRTKQKRLSLFLILLDRRGTNGLDGDYEEDQKQKN
jgi:hypothetical protein